MSGHIDIHVINWTWVFVALSVPYTILTVGTLLFIKRFLDYYNIGTPVSWLKWKK